MKKLELSNVGKTYGKFRALEGVDFSVEDGEFVVMVGPSGCGKSTLLKVIAGLETVTEGAIHIAGEDVTAAEPNDRGIAMVFQSYALYPHMTVEQNMGFGLKLAKRPRAEIEKAVHDAAAILRLESQLDKLPAQLSGGQRQRVAIGRAITRNPEVFLFDEPLSNLDAALRTQMRVELSALHERLGATIIYVTHDQVEAMTMADRIVVLNAGQIEQIGSPLALYTNPANRFVAGFLGAPRMNFFEGVVASVNDRIACIEVGGMLAEEVRLAPHARLSAGSSVVLGIRPEAFQLVDDGANGGLSVRVQVIEHLGRETVFYADGGQVRTIDSDSGTANVTVQVGHSFNATVGNSVSISAASDSLYLFDENGRTISAEKTI
ncbi:sn-glycerol-3-phosphate ABC transporter ATP-binding protein UgpC [Halocynthiibacter sp. C4]|uniref:ABC transporter ATP-binding protein n=1 Tax=Halocynthiibacter sp. C4 TaxID=2992758 RepID=UPI00237BB6B2|nr:sn-glycerol-3-phosphate ABC transporter ATP-binding protein UgpC [Halocynthiibacter sp. C4]MDE0589686.1 sn-glycerol-3-phosphate ABC transporter ATP-binding protein UgpC [Halocynthiibacter sp. C4]